MKTINGGSAVQGGYYLSKGNWEIFPIEKDGQKLPGASSEHYVKLNAAAALALMPVLGGLMVVFLPFIGLFMTAKAVLAPVGRMFSRSAQDLGATITPGWAPGAAHFTGKASEKEIGGESKAGEATLEALSKEIAEKREE